MCQIVQEKALMKNSTCQERSMDLWKGHAVLISWLQRNFSATYGNEWLMKRIY